MITVSQLTELLGWASILNVGVLLFAGIILILLRSFTASIHSKMFGIPEGELAIIYFKYLANYKSLSFVFIIAPYIALKIMGH